MQSSRGPPPHGAAPSPTDHSNTHSAVPSSFHTPEPVPSSPHFFTMNPLTDQRLTGPIMPYQPVDHHPLSSSSTYQDSVPWQYPTPWDPVLDASASSENPSSNALHTLGGIVSPSHEGSSYAPSLPPTRAVQNRNHILAATQACPFPASPTSGSSNNLREGSLSFGANPFTPSPDIWPSHNSGTGVNVSPVTSTIGLATSLGDNPKAKGVQRRSPTESTRGNSRYDPMGRQSRVAPRSGATSEPLTDEGDEERDSDGSVRDVRDKKRRYAKTFRDIEKQLFEKLRNRLFPQDPHAKRSECLERAIESIDEVLHIRESEARRHKEIEDLKQQLADAQRRIEHLCRELNLTIGN